MGLVDKLDDIGKPAWIGLMILGFIAFWPAGLGILAYLIWSGRMGCWTHHGGGDRWQRRMDRLHDRVERMQEKASRWCDSQRRPASSGNRAFDEYRDDTLRRLEGEQREFFEFLDRLRHAKDKAEFDQFMQERGRRASGPSDSPSPQT
ncbi:MAG TPA: DUF2852 domain-containing protein [Alphaproteobacteria bacterium]